MANLNVDNIKYQIVDTYDSIITIPDCFICGDNKLGKGHGEAKLYIGTKDNMREFFGEEGFSVRCFMLKKDLLSYINMVKDEYVNPTKEYKDKVNFPQTWKDHKTKILDLDDVVYFNVADQTQIGGSRGYVNASRTDKGYMLIRTISLPMISYISIMKLKNDQGEHMFYWKIFVDFDLAAERKSSSLMFNYGKANNEPHKRKINRKIVDINNARSGQGKYRDDLLNECPFCPITMVNDERLLIASHIKPWAMSDDREKIDPKNGFMLTPLYDKLFDKGFITFTNDKHMVVSNWLSPKNCQRLQLENNRYFARLPIDEDRQKYLEYHRNYVFKG